MTLYHGTGQRFSDFTSKEGDHLGHHFGTLKQATAGSLKKRHGKNLRVIAVNLIADHPLRTIDAGDWSNSYRVWEVLNKATKGALGEYDFAMNKKPQQWRMAWFIKTLENLGYDSIVYKNRIEGRGDSWIVFRQNQIKMIGEV